MRVVVYEPHGGGHRFHYAALALEAFSDIGTTAILATTRSSIESGDYAIHLSEIANKFSVHEVPELAGGNRFRRAWQESNRIHGTMAATGADHMVFSTASQFIDALAIVRLTKKKQGPTSEALFLGHGYGYELPQLRHRLSTRYQSRVEAMLKLDSIAYIDAIQLKKMKENGLFSQSQKYHVMPDPAPIVSGITKSSAREELGIPKEGRYLGCTGAINKDKRVGDLLHAFSAALPRLSCDVRVLLAGKLTKDVQELVNTEFSGLIEADRLICLDRKLSTREMNIVFPALDVVCAIQVARPGPSGAIVRAAAAGVPVLARARYWSAFMVDQFDLGWTVRSWKREELANSIVSCIESVPNYQPSEKSKYFARFNSETNFRATWTSFVRQRLGLAEDPLRVKWDWDRHGQ